MVDLKDARDLFFKEIETPAGTTCPCCDRYAKLYKRKLNTGMVRTLVWLYMRNAKFGAYAWIDVPRTAPRRTLNSAETGKLAHWGLAEVDASFRGASGSRVTSTCTTTSAGV
jgi:hypothetical protein